MLKENLTFNDLPEMVGRLCKKIESLENVLKDRKKKPGATEHRGGTRADTCRDKT